MINNRQKIWISGGCGFLGSHLVDFLVERDFLVNVLDDNSNGFYINPKANYFQGSILNSEDIQRSLEDCDVVIHLAALLSTNESMSDPQKYITTNILGTKKVFEACEKNKISRVLYASSSAVYGEGKYYDPINDHYFYPDKRSSIAFDFCCLDNKEVLGVRMPSDELDICHPQNVYGLTKQMNEYQAPKNSCGLRFANIYGPRQSKQYSGFLSLMINACLENKSLTIFEDGYQTRNFVHVKDVVRCIYNIMLSDHLGIYNIGSLDSIQVLRFVSFFQHELQKTHLDLEYSISYDVRSGDVRHSQLDVSKYIRDFRDSNFTPLEVGIFELLIPYN